MDTISALLALCDKNQPVTGLSRWPTACSNAGIFFIKLALISFWTNSRMNSEMIYTNDHVTSYKCLASEFKENTVHFELYFDSDGFGQTLYSLLF